MHAQKNRARSMKFGHALIGVIAVAIGAVVGLAGGGTANASPHSMTHQIAVHPLISKATKQPRAAHFGCQDRPIDGSAGFRCYAPAQIQNAYNLTSLLHSGIDGAKKTIVIVDAFQNPYIQTDLATFDSTFGLATPVFNQIAPFGLTPFDPNNPTMDGWAEEISLDVQWAHAIAPGAKILLALAPSSDDQDIFKTTKYVIDHNLGDVISQSFGEAETCVDPKLLDKQHTLFQKAAKKDITVFASSGDSGAAQFNCAGTAAILAASSPASDPSVTGVGGTTLSADANGAYVGETAWTEPLAGCNPPAVAADDINCSGGGFSTLYRRPNFQDQANSNRGRGVPDVAYDGGINGGVLTHCGICNLLSGLDPTDPTVFFIFGGTSSGSPQWSGLIAVGDQLAHGRLGDINPALYTIGRSRSRYAAAFHDITVGNNDVSEIGTGYNTSRKWDAVTGLGTPNASVLLAMLAGKR